MNYSNFIQLNEMVTLVFDLYRNYGDYDYIGEEVTQLQHAIQCADQASREYPGDNSFILGAFLHDIGHMISIHDSKSGEKQLIEYENKSLNGLGLVNHENIGADFLEKLGFSKKVSSLGRNHVMAKRYLITKNSEYLSNLSDASKETFKLQGGVLSETELLDFEKDPNYKVYLRMRNWDDMAKDTQYKYDRNIEYFEQMALDLLIPGSS